MKFKDLHDGEMFYFGADQDFCPLVHVRLGASAPRYYASMDAEVVSLGILARFGRPIPPPAPSGPSWHIGKPGEFGGCEWYGLETYRSMMGILEGERSYFGRYVPVGPIAVIQQLPNGNWWAYVIKEYQVINEVIEIVRFSTSDKGDARAAAKSRWHFLFGERGTASEDRLHWLSSSQCSQQK